MRKPHAISPADQQLTRETNSTPTASLALRKRFTQQASSFGAGQTYGRLTHSAKQGTWTHMDGATSPMHRHHERIAVTERLCTCESRQFDTASLLDTERVLDSFLDEATLISKSFLIAKDRALNRSIYYQKMLHHGQLPNCSPECWDPVCRNLLWKVTVYIEFILIHLLYQHVL